MDFKEREALAKAFADEFKDAWKTREGREALAEKIVKYIRIDVQQRDLSELLLDKDYIPLGQEAEFTEVKGLKAYWHEPGSFAPRSQMIQNVFTVPTKMVSVFPEYELGQMKSGRYGTVVDQMIAARKEILGQTNAMVFNTLKDSISGQNAITASGKLTKSALDLAISWVNDHSDGAKAIVARGSRLDGISDWNYGASGGLGLFSDNMLDQIMRKGIMEAYKGVPIIRLPQYLDGHGQPTINSKTVLVIGDTVGKYVVREEVEQMTDVEISNLMWQMHVWSRIGCAVFHPERCAKITL